MSWLTAWRKRTGLTQQELADKVGIKQPSLSNIEIGAAHPSISLFHALIDACTPSPEEVAGAVAEMRGVKRAASPLRREELEPVAA